MRSYIPIAEGSCKMSFEHLSEFVGEEHVCDQICCSVKDLNEKRPTTAKAQHIPSVPLDSG